MRYPSGPSTALVPVVVAALLLIAPSGIVAAPQSTSPADSSDLVKEAHKRQQDYERFRQSRIPVEQERSGGRCDQRIGRICIWFGGADEEVFPVEPPETERARRGLIAILLETAEQIHDPWVTGQLVHYLVEQRDFGFAERVATECGIAAQWWCSALLGYGMHVRGDFVQAEAAFRKALASMPADERERWMAPRYIFTDDGEKEFDRADPDEQNRQWELFWRLSDPLFLLEGNDRLTDHLARLVQAKNYEDAAHPQAMDWDDDLAETLIRYGRTIGWSRTHSPGANMRGGTFQLQDTRRVVGHHHPQSRGYLFPEEFLQSPSDIPPESWITAPRAARTWYAAPYAPDFRGLETQIGRFRRDEEMLVIGAYRPALAAPEGSGLEAPTSTWDPYGDIRGPVEAALFLAPEDGGALIEVRGSDPEGSFTLRAPSGRYVSSLEVLDREGKRAWRARQGVRQLPLTRGLVAVSDLLILKEGAPLPESLDEAIPYVRPGVRVQNDERFVVVWEVYGLQVREPVQVTIGFTRGRPGFLARIGEFLGVIEPEQPVEVTFGDAGPDQVQSMFRAMVLELPDVDPGEYTLHLRMDLPGREPAISSRPIVIEG